MNAQLTDLIDKLPVDEAPEEVKRVLDQLKIDQLKSITMATGADEFSNLAITRVKSGFEGIMSVMDVEPYDKSDFYPIPADSGAAIAVKFRPDNLAALVKEIAPDQFQNARNSMIEELSLIHI